MNLSFEEGVFAGLLFLLGLLLGLLFRGGDKWRRRHDELHERHRSVEAERDGWRAKHDALDAERGTWAREREEWQRHHAAAPVVTHAEPVPVAPAPIHVDNVAPIRREATVERATEVRRLDPSEVRTVELGDARRIDEGRVGDGQLGGTAAPREGFAPSYPQRSEVKPD